MEGLFSGVPELMRPGVSENGIWAVNCSLVPPTIGWFGISHSEVPSLDSFTCLRSGLVSYRDAGFGQLGGLESNGFPAAGGMLLLTDGEILAAAPYAFFRLTKLAKADLSVNSISSLTEGSLRFSANSLAALPATRVATPLPAAATCSARHACMPDGGISEVAPCAFFRLTKLARADLSQTPWPPLPSTRVRSPPGLQPGCFSAWLSDAGEISDLMVLDLNRSGLKWRGFSQGFPS